MITILLANLHNLGIAIYDAFLFPGSFVLSQFFEHAPTLALKLGISAEGDGVMLPAMISLLAWLLMVIVVWKTVRLLQNFARIVNAEIRSVYSRVSYGIRSRKNMLVYKLRQLIAQRWPSSANSAAEVGFDSLDLAVLNNGAALPPGMALSAPELAGKLTMRPAQVQRSLDKLSKMKLLDYVIGSTDGFDNYRMTQSGAAFAALWQRKLSGS